MSEGSKETTEKRYAKKPVIEPDPDTKEGEAEIVEEDETRTTEEKEE